MCNNFIWQSKMEFFLSCLDPVCNEIQNMEIDKEPGKVYCVSSARSEIIFE